MGRPALLSEDDVEIIKSLAFCGMIDKKVVQEKFQVSEKTSERILNRLGLDHIKQQLIDITRRYLLGESVLDLTKVYGISQPAIHAFFRRQGIKARHAQYTINHDYFKTIDSEEKAYFLGFIYADGCVYKNRLCIALSCVDTPILNKFSEILSSNKPIQFIKPSDEGFKNSTYVARVEFVSDELVKDLSRLGVVPNKTLHCNFPEWIHGHKYARDFLRGFIDGDGSFGKYVLKTTGYIKYGLNACGTQEFLTGLRKCMHEICGSSGTFSKRRKESQNCCYTLQYSGSNKVKTILEYLYEGSSIYLERKYKNYLRITA